MQALKNDDYVFMYNGRSSVRKKREKYSVWRKIHGGLFGLSILVGIAAIGFSIRNIDSTSLSGYFNTISEKRDASGVKYIRYSKELPVVVSNGIMTLQRGLNTYQNISEYEKVWGECKKVLDARVEGVNGNTRRGEYELDIKSVVDNVNVEYWVNMATLNDEVRMITDKFSFRDPDFLVPSMFLVDNVITVNSESKISGGVGTLLPKVMQPCLCGLLYNQDQTSEDFETLNNISIGNLVLNLVNPVIMDARFQQRSTHVQQAQVSLWVLENMKVPFWMGLPKELEISFKTFDKRGSLYQLNTTIKDPSNIINVINCVYILNARVYPQWYLEE